LVAFGVLVVVLKGRGNGGTRERGNEGTREAEGAFPRSLVPSFSRSFWPPIVAITALTFFRLPEALLILRLQDRGVAVAVVPLVWAGLHVVRSASSYPGGWLVDRLGPRRVVAAGGLLFALVALALGSSLGPAAAIALFLLLGLVAGLTESGERAVVARLAPSKMGRGFGSYHALAGAAALPAGLIFGGIYQSVSGQAALWASAAGMGLAVAAWLTVSPMDEGSGR
jgi:MFS family permease